MKKFSILCMSLMVAISVLAVPARRGWQTRTQADGTTIEVQQMGDEFYHYMINRDGKQVREVNGMYVEVGEAPSAEVAKARRAKGVARRQRQGVGLTPNLAPKGVVILVNFSNKSMQSGHTQATFDELCNSENCTVNSGYPSAGQYFADQSNGSYRPQFDVFGPVTLSRNVAYYGTDGSEEGDDQHATDAVVEGCRLVNDQFSINWSDYDSDNDGYVDFVYVIYAGKGQADGGTSETIWPHNWSVESARQSGYCTYTATQCKVGGKKLDNYAMSGEMSGSSLSGIGTLCHEFGHVMGLPDFYDTSYGTNYKNCLTPGDWNIMDGGSYNGDGHCPPNYDPWEKEFFGWHTTVNLGNEGQNVTLYANGTQNYQAYQITTSGSYMAPTTSGLRYYIENRQAVGWDAPLTGHGMLIWKVNFNATKWENNEPNNTANNPYYTVVSASGTKIGWDGSTDNCPKNTFPGSGKVTSYKGISGKPLLNIAERNQVVTLTYIEEPVTPVDPFDVVWKSNGTDFATTQSTGTVVLPADEPEACTSGKVFVGWCSQADYKSATTAPTFVKAGDAVEEGAIFYAVFATQDGEGTAPQEVASVTFKKADNDGTQDYSSSVAEKLVASSTGVSSYGGSKLYAGKEGVKLGTRNDPGTITLTLSSTVNVLKVTINATQYNTDSGKLTVTAGSVSMGAEQAPATGIEFLAGSAIETNTITVATTTKRAYIASISVVAGGGASYSNYSTSCGSGTGVEAISHESESSSRKLIRDGQLIILRDGAEYNVLGVRVK